MAADSPSRSADRFLFPGGFPATRQNSVQCDTAEYAFLSYGQVDFESAVTVQNDEFKAIFHTSYSHLLTSELSQETQYLASILSTTFAQCIAPHKLCTRTMELALEVKFISTFTEFTRPW